MSYFKKFTDFCAGVAAFVAALFFLRKYMAFEPQKPPVIPSTATDSAVSDVIGQATEKFPGKLEQFLTPTQATDYTMIIPLIVLLLLSAILGRVFKRLPYVCFGISLLPAVMIGYMYGTETLYEQIPLFLFVAVIHVIGNLAECLFRDKEDGRHRAMIAARISSAAGAFFCFFIMWKGAQTPPEDPDKISHFENRIFFKMTETDVNVMTKLGVMFLILLAISLILYNLYFVDAILSLIPSAYAIYQVGGEFYTLAPFPLVFLALICTTTHILVCIFENNLSHKEQMELKKL